MSKYQSPLKTSSLLQLSKCSNVQSSFSSLTWDPIKDSFISTSSTILWATYGQVSQALYVRDYVSNFIIW